MVKNKRLKDPIYGYIEIPATYMEEIIDTAQFQRLRRIIQTSYSPLYSSAVHNRFVHSLGVFHLGKIAAESLENEITEKNLSDSILNIEEIKSIFLLACLLHDVGHAPFSHTGENFYRDEDQSAAGLHRRLLTLIGAEHLKQDLPTKKAECAAPHEIMSAIIGLKVYGFLEILKYADNREFFARCITGYQYSDEDVLNDKAYSIKNCFISMLNGKIIDVDKLDYLIRDAYITGFDTVNIDYERLLRAITIIKSNHGYEVAYKKSAISIIENVAYAHDAERKWIQNHPVVLYEGYIIQHMIRYLNDKLNTCDHKLFSEDSLSIQGHELKKKIKVSLMSDDDIIYLFKNVYHDELGMEYFERKNRRHPVWKSEAEYDAYFDVLISSGKLRDEFDQIMKNLTEYLTKSTDTCIINNDLIRKLKRELRELHNSEAREELDADTLKVSIKTKEEMLKMLENMKLYTDRKKLSFDFVLIKASQFKSNFGKEDFSKIKIVFPSKNEKSKDNIVNFIDVASPLNGNIKKRDDFFYLFHKRSGDGNTYIDLQEFSKQLMLGL